ncbi:MAG TPA: sugar transferase [Candidatus Saccharimonadales bacterium]|nr:sugar transferase [Candidatus Saccharimonadales bacterium]
MLYDAIKRLIDIIGSSIAIIFFSPIIIALVLVIKLTSDGPVFFTPLRVGKGGKLFQMLKFRSMQMYQIEGKTVHAEKYLKINPTLRKAYQKNSFKLKDDPRITPVGHILRRLSLDELPQLFNVFVGDMTLVGPRAYQQDELEHQQRVYPHTKKFVKVILESRPGASGPWQVSGRSFINFDKRVEMDAVYVKRRSILYDLQVIIKTPIAMITGRGAI